MKRNYAFTLIEVLVALAILAIALGAAMRALHLATDSAYEIRLRTLATWVAQNRIADLASRRAFPDAGNANGNADMAGVAFHWEQTVSETPNAAFRKVIVDVGQPGIEHNLVSLNAYLVRAPQ